MAAVGIGFGTADRKPVAPVGSLYLEVIAPAEFPSALETVAPAQRAEVEKEALGCKRLAAMMVIEAIPGMADKASGVVQIKSGSYVSPPFAVGAYPVSIMVPMPELIPALTGRMEILGTAKNLRVEMTPPLDLPDLQGSFVQEVYWEASEACATTKG